MSDLRFWLRIGRKLSNGFFFMFRFLSLIAVLAALTGCSTVLDGGTQDIRIETPGAHDSKCTLFNGDFKYVMYPPQTIKISRRHRSLEIDCTAYGNRKRSMIVKGATSDNTMMNFVNGLGPGLAVDYASGALFHYPEIIIVDFTGEKPHMHPYPKYHLEHLENPAVSGMEEFRHGRPMMMRDAYETVPQLQRRSMTDEQASSDISDLMMESDIDAGTGEADYESAPAEGASYDPEAEIK